MWSSLLVVIVIGIAIIFQTINITNGQCNKAGKSNLEALCCNGQNASCFSYEIAGDKDMGRKIKCYCDEHCLRTNDCCKDYGNSCRKKKNLTMDSEEDYEKIDCIMSNWTQWSQCSVTCGRNGVQRRSRHVMLRPSNGGKPCEATQQRKACQSRKACQKPIIRGASGMRNNRWNYYRRKEHEKVKKHLKIKYETIHILPETSMSKQLYEQYNRKNGIAGKLPSISFIHLKQNNNVTNNVYCVKYKVTFASLNCPNWHKLSKMERPFWFISSNFLRTGQQLCLSLSCNYASSFRNRCYGNQLSGGLKWLSKLQKWRAIRSDNCYGYFEIIESPKKCQCSGGPNSYMMI